MDNQPAGTGPAPDKQAAQRPRPTPSFMVLLLFALVIASMLYFGGEKAKRTEISYGEFVQELKEGHIAEATVGSHELYGKFKPGYSKPAKEKGGRGNASGEEVGQRSAGSRKEKPAKSAAKDEGERIRRSLESRCRPRTRPLADGAPGRKLQVREETDNVALQMLFLLGLPLILFAGMWLMFRRARDQFMGGGILSGFNKSPAKRYRERQAAHHFR